MDITDSYYKYVTSGRNVGHDNESARYYSEAFCILSLHVELIS